jgi:NAD+---dinitrogen-reductase ADP-D-ribosyltransferase
MEPTTASLGHCTNLVGLPTPLLGSADFNRTPMDIHISGVREMNAGLFEMLAVSEGLADAADAFGKYMVAAFGIDPEQRPAADDLLGGQASRRPFRSSFLRLLIGWALDSNGPEGAVLKGWAESRFGLFPTFHKDRITGFSGPVWSAYVEEKMSTRFHNNAIQAQLDLLYEFCQWAIARHVALGRTHLTLYRGVNDFDEHPVIDRIDRQTLAVRMNNLASFTADREVADCFGATILTVEVPVAKIVFFNTLLPHFPLRGEGEFLVVGGDYWVRAERL